MDGYYATDGGNSNRIYTTSKVLAYDIETLCTSLGVPSIIDISDRTDDTVLIRGESFKRNFPLYCVRFYNRRGRLTTKDLYIVKNNSIYFKIDKIEKVYDTDSDVYCFETKNGIQLIKDIRGEKLAGIIFSSSVHFLKKSPILLEKDLPRVIISEGKQKFPSVGFDSMSFIDLSLDFLNSRSMVPSFMAVPACRKLSSI